MHINKLSNNLFLIKINLNYFNNNLVIYMNNNNNR